MPEENASSACPWLIAVVSVAATAAFALLAWGAKRMLSWWRSRIVFKTVGNPRAEINFITTGFPDNPSYAVQVKVIGRAFQARQSEAEFQLTGTFIQTDGTRGELQPSDWLPYTYGREVRNPGELYIDPLPKAPRPVASDWVDAKITIRVQVKDRSGKFFDGVVSTVSEVGKGGYRPIT